MLAPKTGVAESLSADQQDEVRRIIREYLAKNPDIVIDAIQAYQVRAEEEKRALQAVAMAHSKAALERDPASPVIGNPDGSVTVVEFMDYRCGYCKKVFPAVQELLKTDGDIRYVVKEFPILGPDSVVASRAAISVWLLAPEKYLAYHTALMEARGGLSEKRVVVMAEEMGLDGQQVAEKMKSADVVDSINRNRDLARALNINGTPAFIVGDQLAPGAVSVDKLRELVAAVRS
ncbi:MAG: thioredoxin domain-containing protein [Rhodospirillales bacterium]|nr:thioredoxin domain-containing protein [Rhodospirillales bacterium]